MKHIAHFIIGISIIACLGIVRNDAVAQSIPAPTILFPEQNGLLVHNTIALRGVTKNNTSVTLFLDDIPAGNAVVKNDPSGTASFWFSPGTLMPGIHSVTAIASDGVITSSQSDTRFFTAVHPTPAPTLFPLLPGAEKGKPWIRGVTKRNTTITLFIDGMQDQVFTPESLGTDTVGFSVKPKNTLTPGWHSISVRAANARGVLSVYSQKQLFLVTNDQDRVVQTSHYAGELPSEGVSIPSAPTLFMFDDSVSKQQQPRISGVVHENLEVKMFVDGILNHEIHAQTSPTGVVGFTSIPFQPLSAGEHFIYAKAKDVRTGKESTISNTVRFFIKPHTSVPLLTNRGISLFPILLRGKEITARASSTPQEPTPEIPLVQPEKQEGSNDPLQPSAEEPAILTPPDQPPITVQQPTVYPTSTQPEIVITTPPLPPIRQPNKPPQRITEEAATDIQSDDLQAPILPQIQVPQPPQQQNNAPGPRNIQQVFGWILIGGGVVGLLFILAPFLKKKNVPQPTAPNIRVPIPQDHIARPSALPVEPPTQPIHQEGMLERAGNQGPNFISQVKNKQNEYPIHDSEIEIQPPQK